MDPHLSIFHKMSLSADSFTMFNGIRTTFREPTELQMPPEIGTLAADFRCSIVTRSQTSKALDDQFPIPCPPYRGR